MLLQADIGGTGWSYHQIFKKPQTSRGVPLESRLPGAFKDLFTQNYLAGGEALGQKKKTVQQCVETLLIEDGEK